MLQAASPTPKRRTLVRLAKAGLYLFLVGLVALGVAVGVAIASLPSFTELRASPNGQMIRVRAADGTVLVSLGPSFGKWLPYRDIPPVMVDAMLAVEDRRYRSHPGIDPIGTARAVKVRVERGAWAQGGSTITQQLARNIFLSNTRTFGRKLREGILALALERKFTKNQILELYLNRVYFGGGAYGIDAASRRFFGHPADDLELSEAAIIAGLVKAPSNYSPTADTEAARDRAEVVIRLMVENGDISAAQAAAADPAEVRLAAMPRQNSARYFTDWALPQLETLIDETVEPLEVWTTLDASMQRAADAAVNRHTPPQTQGALVSIDSDGAVRAMVGGKDYVSSLYNRATQAQRQPGSAFKLFVYLAALESGYKPTDTVVDKPVTIDGWSPRNSSGGYSGPVSLREAFARSLNTVAAQLGDEVGYQTVADMAQRFGVTTPISTRPSMVLGTSDARLIDMTRAFASVASGGTAIVPYGIRKVTTAEGELLYEHERAEPRVLVAPWVAAGMTDLLQSAVMTGTGRAANFGRPVAGKTGTTSSNKDGWFLGFSSGLTTGVWMGRDNARPVPGLQGGHAPALAFRSFMAPATAKRPVKPFTTEVPLPDWQVEGDEDAFLGEGAAEGPVAYDEFGNPVTPEGPVGEPEPRFDAPAAGEPAEPGQADPTSDWLDEVLGRARRPQPQPEPAARPPPPPPPPPRAEEEVEAEPVEI